MSCSWLGISSRSQSLQPLLVAQACAAHRLHTLKYIRMRELNTPTMAGCPMGSLTVAVCKHVAAEAFSLHAWCIRHTRRMQGLAHEAARGLKSTSTSLPAYSPHMAVCVHRLS